MSLRTSHPASSKQLTAQNFEPLYMQVQQEVKQQVDFMSPFAICTHTFRSHARSAQPKLIPSSPALLAKIPMKVATKHLQVKRLLGDLGRTDETCRSRNQTSSSSPHEPTIVWQLHFGASKATLMTRIEEMTARRPGC